jgi:hypothetical protein
MMKKFLIDENLLNIVKNVLKSGVLKCTLEEGSQIFNALNNLAVQPEAETVQKKKEVKEETASSQG